jgi:hypothetical protein
MRGGKVDQCSDGSADAEQASAISKRLNKIANIFSRKKKHSQTDTPVADKSGSRKSSKRKKEKKEKKAREPRDLPPAPIKPTKVEPKEEVAEDKKLTEEVAYDKKLTEEVTDDKKLSTSEGKPVVLESHYYEAEADDETGTDCYDDCNDSAPAAMGSVGQLEQIAPKKDLASSPKASPRKEPPRKALPEGSSMPSPRVASPRTVPSKEAQNGDIESVSRKVIAAPRGVASHQKIQGTASSESGDQGIEHKDSFDILEFVPACIDKIIDNDSVVCRPEPDTPLSSLAAAVKQKNFYGACLAIQETLGFFVADKLSGCGTSSVGRAEFNDAASVLTDDLSKLSSANLDEVDGPLPINLDKLYIAPKDEARGTAEAGDAHDANDEAIPAITNADQEDAHARSNNTRGPEGSQTEASTALDVSEDAVADTPDDAPDTDDDIEGVSALSKQPTPSGIPNDEISAVLSVAAEEKKVQDVEDVVNEATGMEQRDAPPQAEAWKKETPCDQSQKEKKSRHEAQQREVERLKTKLRHYKNSQQKKGQDEIEQARLREDNMSLAGSSAQSSFDLLAMSFDSIKTEKSTLDVSVVRLAAPNSGVSRQCCS